MQIGMIPLSLRRTHTSVSRSSGPETKKPPRSKSSVSTVIARPRVPSVQFLVIAGSNTAGIALCFWNRQKDTSKTHKNRCGGNAAEGGFLGATREPADCSSELFHQQSRGKGITIRRVRSRKILLTPERPLNRRTLPERSLDEASRKLKDRLCRRPFFFNFYPSRMGAGAPYCAGHLKVLPQVGLRLSGATLAEEWGPTEPRAK
jgi:hypothetical protein